MALEPQQMEISYKPAMHQVSIIILNWNGQELLKRYLPSIIDNIPPLAKLIVADNGSTDSSLSLLSNEFPSVEVMKFDRNYGFAEGYNKAIAAITTPYTILLNSDVAADSDWVTPLLDFMNGHPEAAACQPKILSETDRNSFEYAGACGGFIDKHGYPYCRGRIFDTVEKDCGQYDSIAEISWASGAALMVRTEIYNSLGGLDPQFFAHMEEIDLCWRIRTAGYKIFAVTASSVYHLGGGSLAAGNPRKVYLNFRNNLLMMHKNLPDSTHTRTLLFIRRVLDAAAWVKFIAAGDFSSAKAIIKAHRDFATMRKSYTTHPQLDIMTEPQPRRDILLQYFALGRKYFSQLR